MARPSKFNKEAVFITDLKKAKEIKHPIIYGICGEDGKIVYIGKTKNVYKRYEHYLYKPHNENLKEWFCNNDKWVMIVLEINPKNINESEKIWINKIGLKNLFNMVHGGDQNWRHHNREPWMAKQGIMCPSDALLNFLLNRKNIRYKKIKKEISSVIGNMSIKERSLYEIELAKWVIDCFGGEGIKSQIEKWLSLTTSRLISCLEK